MRLVRVVVLLVLAWLACPASALAQIPTRVRTPVPTGRDTIRARGDVPKAVAERIPPTKPSTVFDGDTSGAILCFPKSLPQTY